MGGEIGLEAFLKDVNLHILYSEHARQMLQTLHTARHSHSNISHTITFTSTEPRPQQRLYELKPEKLVGGG